MLISLHLPKTAGSSFARSLHDHFGERLLRDYADLPLNTPRRQRHVRAVLECGRQLLRNLKGVECIHGHFLPMKYLLLGARRGATFVTWLRDPIERIASHYYYWQRTYDSACAPPLHRRVVEENWSLERFCLAPELRNLYCQFLWGFPLRRFDFIGITECYEEDFTRFAQAFLERPARAYQENTNDGCNPRIYVPQGALRRRIAAYHARDMALYRNALHWRWQRPGSAPSGRSDHGVRMSAGHTFYAGANTQ